MTPLDLFLYLLALSGGLVALGIVGLALFALFCYLFGAVKR